MPRLLRLAASLLLLLAPAFATDWKALKPQGGYVSDFAGVIDAQSRAELEDYASRVEQGTGAQLAFVTIKSLNGEPIEDVTVDIFKSFGVGQKKKDNGAMLLLSIDDRKDRLEVGPGLGGAIPDGMSGLLLDDMAPSLRQGKYGAAMIAAAVRLGEAIAKDQGVTIPPPQSYRRVRTSSKGGGGVPWPLIIIGIFILLSLFRRGGGGGYGRGGGGGSFLTGMILGQLLGGGRGGRDGGGFGGFDGGGGGGGFGGFGGGSSGGGGASSGW